MAQHRDFELPLTAAPGEHANDAAQEPIQQTHQHDAQSEPITSTAARRNRNFFTPQASRPSKCSTRSCASARRAASLPRSALAALRKALDADSALATPRLYAAARSIYVEKRVGVENPDSL